MKHKPYKSIFPIRLGCGYRLDVRNNRLIIEERGILLFWKWKVIVDEPLSDKGVKDIAKESV
jgi:hypothetical protein